MPLIFAGIIAAMAGFIAARAEILDPLLPPSMRTTANDTRLAEDLDDATVRLTAVETALAELPAPVEATPAPEVDLSPVQADISALSDRIDTLAAQVQALQDRPAAVADVTVPAEAIDAALAELRDTASAQQAEIDRLLADVQTAQSDAQMAANAALARAAAARITAALQSGTPFADALADLEAAGQSDIPAALRDAAAEGVAPLSQLQADAPDAARAALAAARDSDTSGGLGGFLQRQLGVRSVEPREGSDPDAVLSRIEAAVRENRIGDALAEADALPEPARAALDPWLKQAQSRHDAVSAANALAERLSAL
ncbi:hypothetical protein [uncultured Tateyamaria sp.]|nr:hypothetical protein [uncultured Tateyamaria sp.]